MAKIIKVKICGITNYPDARDAIDCGADALGFVFAKSPRQMQPLAVKNIVKKLPLLIVKVGVFVNAPIDEVSTLLDYCELNLVQLHGEESRSYVWALYPYA
ncbi:MAG: N-(5'-phosphoribosyl)anthranilate isomerase, partial [Planctomycetota bacterium]|nr:N-(5'-phosphoribosyl)anthranilate isomerase [Planctomycetota bacterium]